MNIVKIGSPLTNIYEHPILSTLIKNDVTIYGKFIRSIIFENKSISDYFLDESSVINCYAKLVFKDIIERDLQVLILLPEIALTNQFSRRYKDFFGSEPAIWHSATSKKNKSIIWKGITEGKIKIVIGARSSLFLPFKNLGAIIVDEEHDVCLLYTSPSPRD